jgi:hypothetical protein
MIFYYEVKSEYESLKKTEEETGENVIKNTLFWSCGVFQCG